MFFFAMWTTTEQGNGPRQLCAARRRGARRVSRHFGRTRAREVAARHRGVREVTRHIGGAAEGVRGDAQGSQRGRGTSDGSQRSQSRRPQNRPRGHIVALHGAHSRERSFLQIDQDVRAPPSKCPRKAPETEITSLRSLLFMFPPVIGGNSNAGRHQQAPKNVTLPRTTSPLLPALLLRRSSSDVLAASCGPLATGTALFTTSL